MGKVATKDEVYFHYPIPKNLHGRVKRLSLDIGMPVKDIMINALTIYVSNMNKVLKGDGDTIDDVAIKSAECPLNDYFDDEEL